MIELKIGYENENQRIDKYLMKYLNNAPKSFIYKMIRKKNIKLNNKKMDGSEILKNGDFINLYLADETINKFRVENEIHKTDKDFDIVFEDDNIILAYKPIGLISQPDLNNKNNSLNDQLIYYLYEKGEYTSSSDYKPSICNRLDINTSGIVCFGKNFKTLQTLNYCFKNKDVDKYYLTAIHGELSKKEVITLYHRKYENIVTVSETKKDGYKEIITECTPILTKGNMTLVEVKLITGKTHQIRAVFDYLGYPIVGDAKYNSSNSIKNNKSNIFGMKSQFLHGYKIKFGDIQGELKYLSNQTFICKQMSKKYEEVLSYFQFNISTL